MRGEHVSDSYRAVLDWGSSPHARGARAVPALGEQQRGIIPACAGSTGEVFFPKGTEEDHPRMRGEHRIPYKVTVVDEGSSPHARGAHEGGRLHAA